MIVIDLTPVVLNITYLCMLVLLFGYIHLKTSYRRKKVKNSNSPPESNFACTTPVSTRKRPDVRFRSKRTSRRSGKDEFGVAKRQLFGDDRQVDENLQTNDGYFEVNRNRRTKYDYSPVKINSFSLTSDNPWQPCIKRQTNVESFCRNDNNQITKIDLQRSKIVDKEGSENDIHIKKEIQRQINRQRRLRI